MGPDTQRMGPDTSWSHFAKSSMSWDVIVMCLFYCWIVMT